MKVLVIGQGGREHALAWKLSQSPKVTKVYCAPGNDGMKTVAERVDVSLNNQEGLVRFAREESIDLTVVGPEAVLAGGLCDRFRKEGLRLFGPDRYASRLESSKIFAKKVMQKANVPTAHYETFDSYEKAREYVKTSGCPLVVKAEGLAAGKGVTVALTEGEALGALEDALLEHRFGDSGKRVLIEEYLEGEEASLIVLSDGENILSLAASQDHKRVFDGDRGPNTGGMGAYSPALLVTDEICRFAEQRVFLPVIQEMKNQGHPFVGFLYAGVIRERISRSWSLMCEWGILKPRRSCRVWKRIFLNSS